jgi:hypothetical protein
MFAAIRCAPSRVSILAVDLYRGQVMSAFIDASHTCANECVLICLKRCASFCDVQRTVWSPARSTLGATTYGGIASNSLSYYRLWLCLT